MPDEDTFYSCLKASVEELFKINKNRVFILVDAYDELLSSKDGNFEKAMEEREKVRSFLSLLHETEGANIVVTTRPQYFQELRDSLPGSIAADVHGDLNDMRTYLRERLARLRLQHLLKDEIGDKLISSNESDKW
jgi:hypothetical protein